MRGVELVLLAVGALVGAFLRYRIVQSPLILGTLPINILLVNIVGSLILGAFSSVSDSFHLDVKYTLLVAVGFCGSLTTMSSFALETYNMLDAGNLLKAAANIVANTGLSLGAVIAGRLLVSIIIGA